jgi:hypothetical protein
VRSIVDTDNKSNVVPIAQAVRDWIKTAGSGSFTIQEVAADLGLTGRTERNTLCMILHRLCTDDLIEKYGDRRGQYRIRSEDAEDMDFTSAEGDPFRLVYPLGLERFFYALPKNIIVVAGSPDAGKTAFLFNFIKMNMNRFPFVAGKTNNHIRYLCSDMGPRELKDRLMKFPDMSLNEWKKFEAKERSSNYPDVILPDAINIIDFIEMSENFYAISGILQGIWNRLRNGIAIVAIQKSPEKDLGRGADMGLEKPRLYLSMEHGKIIIMKAKNWVNPEINPRGLELQYKLIHGCEFIITEDWFKGSGTFKPNSFKTKEAA